MSSISTLAVNPSRAQDSQAFSPTEFMPGPEAFMTLTKPFHQNCLSHSYRPALLAEAHHLAGKADSHTAK